MEGVAKSHSKTGMHRRHYGHLCRPLTLSNLHSQVLTFQIPSGAQSKSSLSEHLTLTSVLIPPSPGGLAAVIYTDALQTVIMLIGALTLMGYSKWVSGHLGGWQHLLHEGTSVLTTGISKLFYQKLTPGALLLEAWLL